MPIVGEIPAPFNLLAHAHQSCSCLFLIISSLSQLFSHFRKPKMASSRVGDILSRHKAKYYFLPPRDELVSFVKNTYTHLIFVQVADPFLREMFMMDENKPLPNIAADASTPPVMLMSGSMGIGGGMGAPMVGPMGAGFPMMGGGMPMGPMGPMGPLVPPVAQQMNPMGTGNMQLPPPQGIPQGETDTQYCR